MAGANRNCEPKQRRRATQITKEPPVFAAVPYSTQQAFSSCAEGRSRKLQRISVCCHAHKCPVCFRLVASFFAAHGLLCWALPFSTCFASRSCGVFQALVRVCGFWCRVRGCPMLCFGSTSMPPMDQHTQPRVMSRRRNRSGASQNPRILATAGAPGGSQLSCPVPAWFKVQVFSACCLKRLQESCRGQSSRFLPTLLLRTGMHIVFVEVLTYVTFMCNAHPSAICSCMSRVYRGTSTYTCLTRANSRESLGRRLAGFPADSDRPCTEL